MLKAAPKNLLCIPVPKRNYNLNSHSSVKDEISTLPENIIDTGSFLPYINHSLAQIFLDLCEQALNMAFDMRKRKDIVSNGLF